MSDAMVLVAVISGVSGLIVSLVTHIKMSECSKCFKFETWGITNKTPLLQKGSEKSYVETQPKNIKNIDIV